MTLNSFKLIDNYFQSDDLLKSAWRNVYALEFAKVKRT